MALGVFAALTTLSQGTAYTRTLSSYVEAVKHVLAFGENQRVRESAPGAIIMLVGVVLLSLAK